MIYRRSCINNAGLIWAAALFFMAAAIAAVPASAQQMTQDEVLKGLSERYQNLNSLKATYSRVAASPGTDQIFQSGSSQMATGELVWSRPDKLLLEQQSPARETMVTDGSTVWWYIPAEKLVYRYRNLDVAGQLRPLVSFLGGLNTLNSDFSVSPAPVDKDRPGQHGLILTPRTGAQGGVDRITVWCDGSFILTGFRLTAITGETTDFYLSGFMDNPNVNPSVFKFKIPKGTEIIEEE